MWNVKRAVGKSAAEAKKDLIETLWNVKYEPYHEQTITLPDLIETLWNVKDMSCRTRSPESRGFNRDIVECKEKG